MAHPLLDTAAELGSESDDGDYDEENAGQNEGKPARNTRGMDDSSEEEDEDDDEEAAAAVSICATLLLPLRQHAHLTSLLDSRRLHR